MSRLLTTRIRPFEGTKQYMVQYGDMYVKINGKLDIHWQDICKKNVTWGEQINLLGQSGIVIEDEIGFGGWDEENSVYILYESDPGSDEKCARLFEILVASEEIVRRIGG